MSDNQPHFNGVGFDKTTVAQDLLNIGNKLRSNLFPWNGQFSPQLIEVLLRTYAPKNGLVLDPFAGSGTVLYEAGRLGLPVTGAEINPAACKMAQIYCLMNSPAAMRRNLVNRVEKDLQESLPEQEPSLFNPNGHTSGKDLKDSLVKIHTNVKDRTARSLIEALIVLVDFYLEVTEKKVFGAWANLKARVLSLPESEAPIRLFNRDARRLPLEASEADFVVTSPPYLNVFNYHQQYRKSVEALGWDLLTVARSEIGSNRKHRGNRFLTVIQYCLDMTDVLRELQRVCKESARIVVVVGRESNVRKTRFFNGEIMAALASRCVGLWFSSRQERVFMNRFGDQIYEDILHFDVKKGGTTRPEEPRGIARGGLAKSLPADAARIARRPERSLEIGRRSAVVCDLRRGSRKLAAQRHGKGGPSVSAFPTPHLEKLTAAHENDKLPACDKPRIELAIQRYHEWIKALNAVKGKTPDERLGRLVVLLNDYRLWVDMELIFDSEDNFLYRQKGQLKLDNSILEEFLPRLIHPAVLPEIASFDVAVGPARCFSALYLESSLDVPQIGGGMTIRTKAQDFAVSKELYLKAAHDPTFKDGVVKETFIAYIVAECKTNLDKTMFQEACATAHDVKSAVSGARYYLLCEWLDMTPVSTAATDVDEVIILRKAKRLGSNVRANFGSVKGRKDTRDKYVKHLKDNPLRIEMFQRLLDHVRALLQSEAPVERDVLTKGFF